MELLIGLVVIYVIFTMLSGPGKCDVCEQPIKKTHYKWKIDGKNKNLCPKCNTRMENKISKEAFSKKFG